MNVAGRSLGQQASQGLVRRISELTAGTPRAAFSLGGSYAEDVATVESFAADFLRGDSAGALLG